MQTWFAILCLLAAAMNAQTAEIQFESAGPLTALLELYTSEGCSSCPPAEAWLGRFETSPRLWKDFVPVAFHVDYWDHLGWRDRWSSARFTGRQRAYAAAWRSDTVYTPCAVLNGAEWSDWSRHPDGPPPPTHKSGRLLINSSDSRVWKAEFTPADDRATDWEIHAALLDSGLGSDVKAGENSGRHLVHAFVAVALVDAPLAADGKLARRQFTLDLPATKGRLAIAAWVTAKGGLQPVQATGGWLDQMRVR